VIKNVKEIMENALPLAVKMHVEYNVGRTWFEAK
jgi:DNA polymerase I-like protein with 3'-5' exonuclease and polymerase domains